MSGAPSLQLPPSLHETLLTLTTSGYDAHVVGPCVRLLRAGESVRDFEVATTANLGDLLGLFPRAVVIDASGLRAMLPTRAGPIDLVSHRFGDIEDELAHRDFTLNAVAITPDGAILDPFAGVEDGSRGRLRAVGDADASLAEDPLRALRAVRFVATRGLEIDPELETAVRGVAARLTEIAPIRIREELSLLLLAPKPGAGLALLRSSGLEAEFARNVAADAAALVDRLPADLCLRLAGWLRGTRAIHVLRRLRFPRPQVQRVERLLQLHPVDEFARPSQDLRVRRLARRAAEILPGLLTLREAEIEVRDEGDAARERLAKLRAVIERVQRSDDARSGPTLALDGQAIMAALDCGPGPLVGLAVRYLNESVAADPGCNEPERLRELLQRWRAERGN
jgi:tRNA nucleotidyltransferase/poly(A) polymerase